MTEKIPTLIKKLMQLKSINPYTGECIAAVAEFSARQVQAVFRQSEKAFHFWKYFPVARRADLVRKTGLILHANKELYARTITSEMGKPLRESIAEIEKCAWLCSWYAENGPAFLRNEEILTDAKHSYVRYAPLGTILAIMPWNFPFWQVFRCAVPALLAGNCIVLKHASNVQQCAALIEDIFLKAGCPEGVFKNIPVSSEKVAGLIAHPLVKAVSLTGSPEAGSKVAELAGRHLKKTVLELGGSNPFLVLNDADLPAAVETGFRSRMQNAGQSCIAAKRFIVHQSVYNEFVEMFLQKVQKLVVSDPMNPGTEMGPLAGIEHAVKVERQVTESQYLGATVLYGGHRQGAFFEPTVMINVTADMPVFREEVFGPVAVIIKAPDEPKMMELAGASPFGLGVTVFTSDLGRAEKMIPWFKDGAVFVNEMVKSDPRLPFGGTEKSGYGRELSWHGIREFVNVQTVYIAEP